MFSAQKMINVWEDRYVYSDLNILLCAHVWQQHMVPNKHVWLLYVTLKVKEKEAIPLWGSFKGMKSVCHRGICMPVFIAVLCEINLSAHQPKGMKTSHRTQLLCTIVICPFKKEWKRNRNVEWMRKGQAEICFQLAAGVRR
jgi:hypothetical protein